LKKNGIRPKRLSVQKLKGLIDKDGGPNKGFEEAKDAFEEVCGVLDIVDSRANESEAINTG
jgi:hypothetical protein